MEGTTVPLALIAAVAGDAAVGWAKNSRQRPMTGRGLTGSWWAWWPAWVLWPLLTVPGLVAQLPEFMPEFQHPRLLGVTPNGFLLTLPVG